MQSKKKKERFEELPPLNYNTQYLLIDIAGSSGRRACISESPNQEQILLELLTVLVGYTILHPMVASENLIASLCTASIKSCINVLISTSFHAVPWGTSQLTSLHIA